MSEPRGLFLGKRDDVLCERAAEYLALRVPSLERWTGSRHDPFPALPAEATYDWMLSYLSPWIVPASLLARVRGPAINFHPGPPEYPGIGCTNFAIYEGAQTYGVTCHEMASAVDTGRIVKVVRFPPYPTDTVLSITQRAYAHLATRCYEMVDRLLAGAPLPASEERWTRRPFRRSELDALCRLTTDMTQDEIQRRLRATTFPGYPPASFDVTAPDPNQVGA